MPQPLLIPEPADSRSDEIPIASMSLKRIIPRLSQRDDLFAEQLDQIRATTDRAFATVLVLEWFFAVVLAATISPFAWEGARYSIHEHVWAALFLGGIIAGPPAYLAWTRAGRWWTRQLVATAQILMAALYIHLTHGRIETHFMIFGSLAFLAFYRDWTVLINASLVVLVDHLLRGWLFPESVFGVESAPIWRSFEHFWWVVFEVLFLIFAIERGNRVQSTVARKKLGEMGQYLLKEKIGRGGMGEIYLAEHRLLKRPCAIKLIRPEMAEKASVLLRFEREVRTTAQLRHHNTVEIYDFGHLDDGTFFYVMEHLEGLNLQELVDRHGLPPVARVVYVMRQVCGALCEAHKIGFIHRDIKPENILLCCLGGEHDVAKLFDFGLVRTIGDDDPSSKITKDGACVGTPHYMSPEQVIGEEIDRRSDIYSLGAVAYFLLTGKTPFDGPNALAVMYARLKQPAPVPTRERPDVPPDVERIVLRCLARERSDRFDDALSLQRDLSQCACASEWDDERAALWWEQEDWRSSTPTALQPTKFATPGPTPSDA